MVLPLSIEFPWFSGITEFFGDMFQILCVHHLLMTFGKKRWIHKGKSHKSSLRFFLPLNVFFLSYPQKITICNSTAREIWLKSPSINLSYFERTFKIQLYNPNVSWFPSFLPCHSNWRILTRVKTAFAFSLNHVKVFENHAKSLILVL